ncbi:MAG TPA: hypothetical protein VNX61_12180 [Rhizomicrobium sp.]|nr:hypothetical protein [Rhizomicrobium sp.]
MDVEGRESALVDDVPRGVPTPAAPGAADVPWLVDPTAPAMPALVPMPPVAVPPAPAE